jgi:predicted metallopeptidase
VDGSCFTLVNKQKEPTMAKATYAPASNSVIDMIEKIINTFPDKFIHIVPTDLAVLFKDQSKKSTDEIVTRIKAKTRVLSAPLQLLTRKKILIEILQQEWELSSENQRALLIYHELFHILFDDKKREYRMRKPDVKGFYELLKTLGLNYENADTFFTAALNPVTTGTGNI